MLVFANHHFIWHAHVIDGNYCCCCLYLEYVWVYPCRKVTFDYFAWRQRSMVYMRGCADLTVVRCITMKHSKNTRKTRFWPGGFGNTTPLRVVRRETFCLYPLEYKEETLWTKITKKTSGHAGHSTGMFSANQEGTRSMYPLYPYSKLRIVAIMFCILDTRNPTANHP